MELAAWANIIGRNLPPLEDFQATLPLLDALMTMETLGPVLGWQVGTESDVDFS
jgi:hypothetical protein